MTLIVIKTFLARLFGSRYTWYAIAAGAALYGAAHWHYARVDDVNLLGELFKKAFEDDASHNKQ